MSQTETAGKKRVRFEIATEPGHEVFVAGDFNGWKPGEARLKPRGSQGKYTTTLMLEKGVHEYKFVVDGNWQVDPNNPNRVPNGAGSLNSLLQV